MGGCSSAPRCRVPGCSRYASANNYMNGYCRTHYRTQRQPQPYQQQQQQQPQMSSGPYQINNNNPPPPAYTSSPQYQQQPMAASPVYTQQPPQQQQPTLSCPHCRQPLVAPPNVQQLRCPRCQCVFSVSQPTPAAYTSSYQPQYVIVQQPQVIVEPYPVGYGYGGYGGGYGYGGGFGGGYGYGGGGDVALAVGGGLLGGLLLADVVGGGFW